MKLCGLLVLVFVVGCGSAAAPSKPSRPPAPTPEEKAVTSFAQGLYPQQNIVSSSCTKVGFSPAGDIYSCSLVSADGSSTQPSNWTIMRGSSGGDIQAIPETSG